jgi:hypothetical protein
VEQLTLCRLHYLIKIKSPDIEKNAHLQLVIYAAFDEIAK